MCISIISNPTYCCPTINLPCSSPLQSLTFLLIRHTPLGASCCWWWVLAGRALMAECLWNSGLCTHVGSLPPFRCGDRCCSAPPRWSWGWRRLPSPGRWPGLAPVCSQEARWGCRSPAPPCWRSRRWALTRTGPWGWRAPRRRELCQPWHGGRPQHR